MQQYNLVLSGLGGQGVMTISHVLAAAAHRENVPVRVFEGTGMTQRGGGVYAYFRFGETTSPKILAGEGDGIIGLELSEIASVIHNLRDNGRVWANSGKIHGHYSKLKPELYPTQESIQGLIELKTKHYGFVPAHRLAEEAGSVQAVNMVMLGAFCQGTDLLSQAAVEWAIESGNPKFAAKNLEAFHKGYEFSA